MDYEILTLEQAAELFNVSVKTFIKLLKEEKVPARKIGREWRFSRKALIEWLSAGDSQVYSASEGETKEFFNKVATEWEEFRKTYDEPVRDKLVGSGFLKRSEVLVDLGCGDGFLSRAVAPLVKKVIAVDISAEMLKLLGKKAAEAGITNIQTLESDAQDIPLADATADIICASMYLHHIEQPDVAVREMQRVLKPGGLVFIADLSEHKNREMMDRMHDVWPGFKQTELKSWFSKNGFSKVSIEKLPSRDSGDSREEIIVLTAVKEL